MIIKKNKPIVIFLVAGGLLVFLHGVGALRPAENLLLFLTKPFLARFYQDGVALNGSYEAAQNKEDLEKKVSDLTATVAQLTVADSRCAETVEENKRLRETLQFLNVNNFQAVVANIIARETTAADNYDLIINRGSRDGLRSGLGVVSAEGVIVGQVVEVKDATAKICLTTSPRCQLAAAIQNQDKTQGITDGDLGLTVRMNYIPQLDQIAPGDTVVTSGLGGGIPRGLIIGKVTQVQNASNEVWQSATIEPLVNLNSLTVVSVIIP
ncbi:TPA: rod shape-determining protein MreC [Candidatus Falkowbacteria bacterium]|nr:MAG: Cell shape-determining protein MreC [Candidatus Falkowbacteria bacterium GW2011_GWF2_43_32]HBA36747.1 rod shape-determining protein MreC [Candidatus Falkowbacteria bacterium]